jgi:hypothetical protein
MGNSHAYPVALDAAITDVKLAAHLRRIFTSAMTDARQKARRSEQVFRGCPSMGPHSTIIHVFNCYGFSGPTTRFVQSVSS